MPEFSSWFTAPEDDIRGEFASTTADTQPETLMWLCRRAGDVVATSVVPQIAALLRHAEPRVRMAAAEAFERLGESTASVSIAVAIDTEADEGVLRYLLIAAGYSGGGVVQGPLTRSLSDERPAVRRFAAEALWRIRATGSLDALLDASRHESDRRTAAELALAIDQLSRRLPVIQDVAGANWVPHLGSEGMDAYLPHWAVRLVSGLSVRLTADGSRIGFDPAGLEPPVEPHHSANPLVNVITSDPMNQLLRRRQILARVDRDLLGPALAAAEDPWTKSFLLQDWPLWMDDGLHYFAHLIDAPEPEVRASAVGVIHPSELDGLTTLLIERLYVEREAQVRHELILALGRCPASAARAQALGASLTSADQVERLCAAAALVWNPEPELRGAIDTAIRNEPWAAALERQHVAFGLLTAPGVTDAQRPPS